MKKNKKNLRKTTELSFKFLYHKNDLSLLENARRRRSKKYEWMKVDRQKKKQEIGNNINEITVSNNNNWQ